MQAGRSNTEVNSRIPILICIDVEPNERVIDPGVPADWTGFERTVEFFSELRPRLETATRSAVHFSWFLRMDPQITDTSGSPDWVVTRYPRLIAELEAAGDELGLHSHAFRWDAPAHDWVADYANQEWVDHCVRSSFEAFQTSLHRQCRSFRFGDHWMNDQTIGLLEKLGARFDLTLEPGAATPQMPGEIFTGAFPDYSRIPQVPYRPHVSDFKKPSWWWKRDLWIIPISAGVKASAIASPEAKGRMWPASNPGLPQEYMSLILGFDPSSFSRIANKLLSQLKRPYLALPARTDMALYPDRRSILERNIEFLVTHPLVKDFSFDTPAEALSRLR